MIVERLPVADEYVEQGEGVYLLPDHRVLALSALGTAVMGCLREGPLNLTALASRIVEDFGDPGGSADPEQFLAGILHEMSNSGLLALGAE